MGFYAKLARNIFYKRTLSLIGSEKIRTWGRKVKKRVLVGPLLMLTLLIAPAIARGGLPSPGVTPDSWLYGLDRAIEALQKAFTFTPEAKVKLALQLAAERLSEAREMLERGKAELAASIAEDYRKEMDEAARYGGAMAEAAKRGEARNAINQAASAHLKVLKEVMPDSPLYPCKRKAEDIGIGVAQTLEEKARRQLSAAGDRIEEAKAMVEEEKLELARKALEDYEEGLGKALNYGEAIAELAKKKEFEELVFEATSVHINVLERVLEKAPDAAKPAIEKAIAASKKGQEEAIERIREVEPAEAAKLYLKLAEDKLQKLKEKVKEGRIKEAIKLMEEYQRNISKSLEIVDEARGAGKGVAEAAEKIALATSKHLEILEGVRDRVREEAKPAIERSMKVSARGQERALEALRKENPRRAKKVEEAIPGNVKEIKERIGVPAGPKK